MHCGLLTQKRKRKKSLNTAREYKFDFGCFSRYLCWSQITHPVLNININTLYCLSFSIKFSFSNQHTAQRWTKNLTKLKKESPFHPWSCHTSLLHIGKQRASLLSHSFYSLQISSPRWRIPVILIPVNRQCWAVSSNP